MNIKLLHQEEMKVSFEIKEVHPAFVNTLRRVIMEEVPTLAIEEVNFVENSSALYDEMIALRLGLIPLKTDLKSYVLPEDAKNESDPSAFLNLKLKVVGPKTVYASDLHSKIQPVYPKIIIVKLLANQHLELETKAILGKGKQHMKFAPGLAFYHHTYKVNVKQKDAKEFKDKYPPHIFDKEGKINTKLINTVRLIDACKNVNNDIIEVSEEKDSFEFHIESWGQLKLKEILTEAIHICEEKLNLFEKEIGKIK